MGAAIGGSLMGVPHYGRNFSSRATPPCEIVLQLALALAGAANYALVNGIERALNRTRKRTDERRNCGRSSSPKKVRIFADS